MTKIIENNNYKNIIKLIKKEVMKIEKKIIKNEEIPEDPTRF